MKVRCSRALHCNCPDNLGPDDINNINIAYASEHLPHCIVPLKPAALLGAVSLMLSELPPCKDLKKLLNVIEALLVPEPPYQQCLAENFSKYSHCNPDFRYTLQVKLNQ